MQIIIVVIMLAIATKSVHGFAIASKNASVKNFARCMSSSAADNKKSSPGVPVERGSSSGLTKAGAQAFPALYRGEDPFSLIARTPMNPFDMLDTMTRMLGRFEDPSGTNWNPAMDVTETKKAFHVDLDLPGVKKADIHLHVEGDMLTLSAEKKGETKEEDAEHTYRVVERFSGEITTRLRIPKNTNLEHIHSEFTDGVLHITLPKIVPDKEVVKKKMPINVK